MSHAATYPPYLPPGRCSEVVPGASRSRVYEWISSGKVESVKVGRSRLVVTESLLGYIELLRSEQHDAHVA